MSSFWDEFMEAVEEFLRLLFAPPVESFVETFGDETPPTHRRHASTECRVHRADERPVGSHL